MRAFASQLDLGTIIQYDDQKGVIAVVVDPARLAEPEFSSTKLTSAPEPPEPADVRARRRAARSKAGLDPPLQRPARPSPGSSREFDPRSPPFSPRFGPRSFPRAPRFPLDEPTP